MIKVLSFTELSLPQKIQFLSKSFDKPMKLATSIITCESGMKADAFHVNPAHYNKKGVFIATSTDHGYWELNDTWIPTLLDNGFDVVHNPDDNLKAGFWIWNKYGIWPWSASQGCWKNDA